MGGARHRSACARMAWAALETISAYCPRPAPTPLISSTLRLDVESIGRSPKVAPRMSACGTVSKVDAPAAKPGRRLRAALVHKCGQHINGGRPNVKMVVPKKILEQA